MTRVARNSSSLRAVGVVLTALALLSVPATPASAHHVKSFSDARGDANGINDQLEGFCCDVSTPPASQPQADIVATSIRTLYRNGRPVATQLRITMATAVKGKDFRYELRTSSARCGSIFGDFTAEDGYITEECFTNIRRQAHDVAVHSKGRTLFVRLPYNLNPAARLLAPGDRLRAFQTIARFGPTLPRLDWANAPRDLTFTVGR